jgi:hypothetical protein
MDNNGLIKVSVMTGKLKGFYGVNFNPLDNAFCAKMAKKEGTVCSYCYSRRMISTFRKSCAKPFTNNAKVMSEIMHDQLLPRFMPGAYVRFLAHGELENVPQLINFFRIAKVNRDTTFALWTKRTDILFELFHDDGLAYDKPANLNIIQSSPFLNQKSPEKAPYVDAIFTVYESGDADTTADFLCNGKNCSECMHCYKEDPTDVSEILRK